MCKNVILIFYEIENFSSWNGHGKDIGTSIPIHQFYFPSWSETGILSVTRYICSAAGWQTHITLLNYFPLSLMLYHFGGGYARAPALCIMIFILRDIARKLICTRYAVSYSARLNETHERHMPDINNIQLKSGRENQHVNCKYIQPIPEFCK